MLVLCIFLPRNDAYGQILLHDKRLKTTKKEKKKSRKRIFKAEDGKKSKEENVKVRTSSSPGRVRDERKLNKPAIEENTQNFDFKQKEQSRPYRPELGYEGYRKAKKSKKNPNKIESNYSGNLKSSSTVLKPQRGVANSNRGAKGKSERAIERDFKKKSNEMHRFAGKVKQKKDRKKSQEGDFQGRFKAPSLSSKTKYAKRLSRNVHQYQGDIKIKRNKHENLHPSVAYLEGKKKNTRNKKEKLRKRKIFWFKIRKNSDQPNSVKQKPAKPKYDSRESEIWYD